MVKTEIQIIVATHKPFPMPGDEMYLPLFVGAAERQPVGYVPEATQTESGEYTPGRVPDGRNGYTPDNTGDNISDQNHIYSELTGLYWAWKNLDASYIGLVHYRRYFKEPHAGSRKRREEVPEISAAWKRIQSDMESVPQRIPEPVPQRISQKDLPLTHQRNMQDAAMEIGSEAFQWQDIADAGWPNYDLLNKSGFYAEGTMEDILSVDDFRQKSDGLDYSKQLARVLTYESLQPMLAETDIILPRRRNYHIETLYSHYAHTHCAEHLDVTREIIGQRCPEYVPAFDEVMQRTGAHMFNMIIMSKERLDEYCSWLFPILAELVERIDASGYDAYQARFPGRVSELMLDVWLAKSGYCYRELPMLMIGPKHWGRKMVSFLGAKFLGRRYKESY